MSWHNAAFFCFKCGALRLQTITLPWCVQARHATLSTLHCMVTIGAFTASHHSRFLRGSSCDNYIGAVRNINRQLQWISATPTRWLNGPTIRDSNLASRDGIRLATTEEELMIYDATIGIVTMYNSVRTRHPNEFNHKSLEGA